MNSISRYLALYPFIRKSHFHDFYSILLVTGGYGSIKICNDSVDLKAGELCLFSPNQLHAFECLENAEGIVFLFCQDFYVEEFSFIRLLNVFSNAFPKGRHIHSPGYKLPEQDTGPVADILVMIRQEYEMPPAGNISSAIIRSLLNIVLLKLSDLYKAKRDKSDKAESTIINNLSYFIESHFIQEHNIGFYCKALHISEKHLNDTCNTAFGCGLKKILHDRLMQESRRLLLSSELSISEIAYKLYFHDNSYFNKVFRQSTGLTPGRFREMHKKLLP